MLTIFTLVIKRIVSQLEWSPLTVLQCLFYSQDAVEDFWQGIEYCRSMQRMKIPLPLTNPTVKQFMLNTFKAKHCWSGSPAGVRNEAKGDNPASQQGRESSFISKENGKVTANPGTSVVTLLTGLSPASVCRKNL